MDCPLSVTGVKKSCPQSVFDTGLYLTPLDIEIKSAAQSIPHSPFPLIHSVMRPLTVLCLTPLDIEINNAACSAMRPRKSYCWNQRS